MQAAADYHEQLLVKLLTSVFGELDAAATALLRDQLRWVALAGGQTLMAEGEPGDSMYISVSGRLRAYVRQDDGTQRMVREMSRGQVIGEMSLITDEPRSATVVAIRDSVLVRLDKTAFTHLIAGSAQVAVALTRQIIQRLKTEHHTATYAAPVTIGLMPISAKVDAAHFARDLAAHLQRHGRVRVVDAALMAVGGADEDPSETHRRVSMTLDEIETAHEFVLLVGDATPTPWTQACTRHCDELLLLADAGEPAQIHPVERQCLMNRPPRSEACEILVLLHDAATRCPSGTAAWLDRRPLADHVHLRPTLERDVARLARLLARQGVGLVLAGGGARGFAHLGVMRALAEQGIEVDCVGGTSMGALMALMVGSDQPLEQLMPMLRSAFRRNPTGDFNLVPLLSFVNGGRVRDLLRRGVREMLGGDAAIEDLWKNTFFVATNYSQAREELLQRGDLHRSVLASMSIPGALPPVVVDGDLLCDGGTFNNFPVDLMRARRGIGCVIGVDLSARKARRIELSETPGPWALLRDKLRPRRSRRYHLPSLSSILLNATILYSESRLAAAERLIDIHIKPPLERVGLLQWSRFDAIVQQGYEHAKTVLAQHAAAGAR